MRRMIADEIAREFARALAGRSDLAGAIVTALQRETPPGSRACKPAGFVSGGPTSRANGDARGIRPNNPDATTLPRPLQGEPHNGVQTSYP
jgi:hypothetical protein